MSVQICDQHEREIQWWQQTSQHTLTVQVHSHASTCIPAPPLVILICESHLRFFFPFYSEGSSWILSLLNASLIHLFLSFSVFLLLERSVIPCPWTATSYQLPSAFLCSKCILMQPSALLSSQCTLIDPSALLSIQVHSHAPSALISKETVPHSLDSIPLLTQRDFTIPLHNFFSKTLTLFVCQ